MSRQKSAPERVARRRLPNALESKLTAPGAIAAPVIRKSLCTKMCAADTAQLIVVQAPAGFGKTTAMLQFRDRLEVQGVATAWLKLDRTDNDAAQFLKYFNLAVRNLNPEVQTGASPVESVDSLLLRSAPFVIFLDNFEITVRRDEFNEPTMRRAGLPEMMPPLRPFHEEQS